jgi:hypothetical protein
MVRKIPATQALAGLGYQLLRGRVYKATWSGPDVEHFIYLNGGPGGVSASFGYSQSPCRGLRTTGDHQIWGETIARALNHVYDARSTCTMHYPFSYFDPFWHGSARILSDPKLARLIGDIVTRQVLPAIRHVTTIDKLLSLLIADDPPWRWNVVNGAIRAAQILVLADQCAVPIAQTRAILEAKAHWIANGFLKSSPMRSSPIAYIPGIVGDLNASPSTQALGVQDIDSLVPLKNLLPVGNEWRTCHARVSSVHHWARRPCSGPHRPVL